MTIELVETSRLFARTVARIRPEWVGPLAKDTYSTMSIRTHMEFFAGRGLRSRKSDALRADIDHRPLGVAGTAGFLPPLGSIRGAAPTDSPLRSLSKAQSRREIAIEMFIRHALVQGPVA